MYTVVYLSNVPANIDYKQFYSQLANNLGKQIDMVKTCKQEIKWLKDGLM